MDQAINELKIVKETVKERYFQRLEAQRAASNPTAATKAAHAEGWSQAGAGAGGAGAGSTGQSGSGLDAATLKAFDALRVGPAKPDRRSAPSYARFSRGSSSIPARYACRGGCYGFVVTLT